MFYSRAPKLFGNCKSVQTSSPTSLLLCFSLPPAPNTAARRRRRPQATSCFARRLTWQLRSLWTHFPTRCTPPPLATLPPASSVAATSPPPWPAQRRAEPRLPNSRVPQHLEESRTTFPSLPRSLSAQNLQNTAAVQPSSDELEAHRRPAPAALLRPRRPHYQLHLSLASSIGIACLLSAINIRTTDGVVFAIMTLCETLSVLMNSAKVAVCGNGGYVFERTSHMP